jgi:uncharacterized protein (TIGR02271 family)
VDEHVSADERPHADAPEAVASIETLRDGSVVVPVAEEELLVGKRRRVRERIIVRKRTESREEHVNEEVRRERVEITADDGVAFEDDVARPVRGLASAEERRLRALLTVDDIPMLRNVPVITADDEEVGRVGYIDYEPDTGEIRNVGVSRGFLGLRRLEVSVADALLRPDALQLAYTKQELEALGEGESAAVDEEAAPVGEPTPVEPDSSSLVRHEEELRVERRVREIGNLHAVKHVETEPVHRVAHRDVEHFETVDRQPVDSEDDSGEITMLEDGSISIPVFEEVLIIEKRPMIRERIVIKKESEAERYRVETRLRRERIEADSESA